MVLANDSYKDARTAGVGIGVIAILIIIMHLFEGMLPAGFAYIALGIILVDVVLIILDGNTVCRK